jgi:ATP-dependent RNA helicase SUPV3L1/SUV3
LAPLRLLAYEQYDKLNRDGCPCSMITGEERILMPGSFHQSSTIEMMNLHEEWDMAVIDEAQMVADS